MCKIPLLILAVKNNDIKSVKNLICNGADVNACYNGETVLYIALRLNYISLVRYLLHKGATWPCGGVPCSKLSTEAYRVLIEFNIDINIDVCHGHSPIYHAIKHGDLRLVRFLVRRGIYIDNKMAENSYILRYLITSKYNFAIIKLLLYKGKLFNILDPSKKAPLQYAIDMKKEELVDFLLKNGARVDIKDEHFATPLCNAIVKNCKGIICKLLEYGAGNYIGIFDTMALSLVISSTNSMLVSTILKYVPIDNLTRDYSTVLLCNAIESKSYKITQIILQLGIDVNVSNDRGYSPLHINVFNYNRKIFDILIEYGANIHARDFEGNTVLHTASSFSRYHIVTRLLDMGADICAVNSLGETPIDKAHGCEKKSCRKTMHVLISHLMLIQRKQQRNDALYIHRNENSLKIIQYYKEELDSLSTIYLAPRYTLYDFMTENDTNVLARFSNNKKILELKKSRYYDRLGAIKIAESKIRHSLLCDAVHYANMYIEKLPDEIWLKIFQLMENIDLVSVIRL
ncbi:ankyrin repeat family protein [Turkeypox virus]|uniref:Ankyrin repeat family protein n=1 Tax=Turkeypox virus TaxID=336486 RepID=A0A0M3ZEI0_9POXV|nr:ankyrin repeat family protein [Turkeypox virus]ALA62381.1 ankyrin repeat family protein [Turkeypox virus]